MFPEKWGRSRIARRYYLKNRTLLLDQKIILPIEYRLNPDVGLLREPEQSRLEEAPGI